MIVSRSFYREWWMNIDDKLVERAVAAGHRVLVQGLKKKNIVKFTKNAVPIVPMVTCPLNNNIGVFV